MIKKNAERTIPQKLMAHAIKLLGSEERARAMLAAGTLRLLVPKERRAPDRARKPCGAFARSTGKALPSPRQRPWRPLQAAWRHEHRSQDRTGKAAAAGSNEATLAQEAQRASLTRQLFGSRSARICERCRACPRASWGPRLLRSDCLLPADLEMPASQNLGPGAFSIRTATLAGISLAVADQ